MKDFYKLALLSCVAGAAVDYWQDPESSTSVLLRRQATNPNDPNFASYYPPGGSTPPTSSIPQAWLDKLATVQLPSFGPSSPNNGYPTYQNGLSGADPTVCSFTYQCTAPDDLVNAPNGTLALSFDDGPSGGSQQLYAFLAQNNISSKATHFMIGGNILSNPTQMQAAVTAGGHIAVHTWSHPYMTPLSNQQVVAELGWTMQIISDLNGGRVPAFWRPPFGDVDNRVRAIAKGVFGLETVPWNQDSADWAIGNNPQYTLQSVESMMSGWLSGPKSPGLVILEHELNANTVGVFQASYPVMVQNGWNVENVADAFSMSWYQNAQSGNTGSVTPMNITTGSGATNSTASSSSMTSTTITTTSTKSSATKSSASSTASTAAAAIVTSSKSAGERVQAGIWVMIAALMLSLAP